MEVGEMTDLVNDHGAAVTAGLRPTIHARREHEVIQHELVPAVEQITQVRRAMGSSEDIVLLDACHGLPAPFRGEYIPRPRRRFFLRKELLVSRLPLRLRDDFG